MPTTRTTKRETAAVQLAAFLALVLTALSLGLAARPAGAVALARPATPAPHVAVALVAAEASCGTEPAAPAPSPPSRVAAFLDAGRCTE